jgi:hypothetical protein
MSATIIRELQTVIVTDRVLLPGHFGSREWSVGDTLHTLYLPQGSGEVEQGVLVVANRREHLQPLAAVGTALAAWSAVDQLDWGLNADAYRQGAALTAGALGGDAMRALKSALDNARIDPLVCSKMMERLEKKKYERGSFSSDWEYASIFYAVLTSPGLVGYAEKLKRAFFGELELSDATNRKDLSRGREYQDRLFGSATPVGGNYPTHHRIELTEMYLCAALPVLLELGRAGFGVNLSEGVSVTSTRVDVTAKIQKSGNEKNIRPAAGTPFATICQGLVTR